MTYVPFTGNAPDATPNVVARNVDPDDSVPNTDIIRLGSTEFDGDGWFIELVLSMADANGDDRDIR